MNSTLNICISNIDQLWGTLFFVLTSKILQLFIKFTFYKLSLASWDNYCFVWSIIQCSDIAMILPLYSLVNIDSFVRRGVPDSLSLREGSIMIQSWTQEAKELQQNHLAFSLYLKILQPFLSLTLIGFCDEIRRGEVLHLPIWLFLRSKFLSTQPNTFQHFSLNPTSHAH